MHLNVFMHESAKDTICSFIHLSSRISFNKYGSYYNILYIECECNQNNISNI